MRTVKQSQMKLGEVDIAAVEFDKRSRDEIPKLLMGLQYLWCNRELRSKMQAILEKIVPDDTQAHTGRPGMDLWKILVLGTLRLNCNFDYDKLQELANQHNSLRQMLGHNFMDTEYYYPLQTLKDNVCLLTPKCLTKSISLL